MIHDENLALLRKKLFYAAPSMEDMVTWATGLESATSTISELTGLDLTAGNVTTANDGFDWFDMIPYDLDYERPVGVTPLYTKDATGTTHVTSFTWAAKYVHIGPGGALAEPGGGTALDTVIGADTQAAAADSLKMYVGNRGVINANTFKQTDIFWAFQILLTAFTASGNDKMWLLGVIVDYMPHVTIGKGVRLDRPLRTNHLGKTWGQSGG